MRRKENLIPSGKDSVDALFTIILRVFGSQFTINPAFAYIRTYLSFGNMWRVKLEVRFQLTQLVYS